MLLSFKYRICPNKTQAAFLGNMLSDFCDLYNAALEQRILAYRRGVSVHFEEQCAALPAIRRDAPDAHGRWSCTAQQQVLRKLNKAYEAFFGRASKKQKKAGFPRFKNVARYVSADFRVGNGVRLLKNKKLFIVGIPNGIKVRWHRALPTKPKSCVVTQKAGKWYVVFHVEVGAVNRAATSSVGLDVGLRNLIAESSGTTVKRPNITNQYAKKLRLLRRALARCTRGSCAYHKRKMVVAKLYARVANVRRDFLHKESRRIVNQYGRIAVEDLNIKGLAAGRLAKHVNDAAWGMLILMLRYKAANAGGELVEVDPRGTSQTCPGCGTVTAKTLAEREHRCDCGCVLDRDVAAAMVVHFRAFGFWPGTGLDQLTQRNAA